MLPGSHALPLLDVSLPKLGRRDCVAAIFPCASALLTYMPPAPAVCRVALSADAGGSGGEPGGDAVGRRWLSVIIAGEPFPGTRRMDHSGLC
jgi:hypothetical protein